MKNTLNLNVDVRSLLPEVDSRRVDVRTLMPEIDTSRGIYHIYMYITIIAIIMRVTVLLGKVGRLFVLT